MKPRYLIAIFLLVLAGQAAAGSLGDRLANVLYGGEDEILDPEEAFRIDSRVINAHKLEISWDIEPGYYLYRDKFAFKSDVPGLVAATVPIPPGDIIEDPLFGKVMINTGFLKVAVPLQRQVPAPPRELALEVNYQGCKKDSVCYPPISKTLDFTLPAAETQAMPDDPVPVSEQDAITRRLAEGSLLINIALFFGFGLLLSLTPCVFPMIPILSGVIVGQGRQLSTAAAFMLSLVYVLAMALTYSVLGVIAGSCHLNLQAAAQNAWVITAFSLVFVCLALSMFGFYKIQLPAGLQDRLHQLSHRQQAGSMLGVAIMGILSAIIVGPCVAPPLAGALLYISQTGNALLGGLALFAMGLGFGVPLLAVGTSAGRLLPRAGAWMDVIKAIFGVFMLAVAIWFLERILPGPVTLLLWAALLIVSAMYMGALDRIDGRLPWSRLWKGLGLVMLIYGVVLVFGAAAGGSNVLQPLPKHLFAQAGGGTARAENRLEFQRVGTSEDLAAFLERASRQGKPAMLDFYAKWCVDCNKMEEHTFPDPAVQATLSELVLLKADVTGNTASDQALLRQFDLFGPPAILFFDAQGKELPALRLVGFVNAEAFNAHVRQVLTQ